MTPSQSGEADAAHPPHTKLHDGKRNTDMKKRKLQSVDTILAKEIAVLEDRQTRRRAMAQELDDLIEMKQRELENLKARLQD
jgi:DNA-binding helix-hairpin-helix protein with protein kinase domain